ncbi:MAG: alpha-amylase family glycosyl hydrolase [bacterium]|nr:alpha-amylase family glycosyl hydrolase [bacterium]
MSWYEESVIYQIYPLGFCGAPKKNNGKLVPRIRKVVDWIPYYKELGIDVILFNPIFESEIHGYDTKEYRKVDVRLGNNEDFKYVSEELHKNGIRVMLDGVFNHVGRGFFAFQDVLKNREDSRYKDWFYIRFEEDSPYRDGLGYVGWEGHYDLVKLNLENEEVVEYLFSAIRQWVQEFNLDGLRIDVAYCINKHFLKRLRTFTASLKEDFILTGEVLFGDYNIFVNDQMLHSCTNYECYKGIHSSLNDLNLFEINYSLNRQFSRRQNGIYQRLSLLNFVDNHDVSRIASILNDKEELPLAYTLLFTMPGVPCIYYGSEWGEKGDKKDGDNKLRPKFKAPVKNQYFIFHQLLISIYKQEKALQYGDYDTIMISNKQLVFKREYKGESILVLLNAENKQKNVSLGEIKGEATNLLTKEVAVLEDEITMEPYDVMLFKLSACKMK